MLRALFWTLALSAACAAALFVPIAGKSLWERSRAHGLPQLAQRTSAQVTTWFKGKKPPARPRPAVAVKKQPVAEKLTQADRSALDQLVAGSR